VTLYTNKYTGTMSKTIQVFTNDPERPKISLRVRATVRE